MKHQTMERSTEPRPQAHSRADVCGRISALRSELDRLGVESLQIFGSAARDNLSETSDVDVLATFRGPAEFDRFMDLKFLLEDTLARRVDLVTPAALKPRLATLIAPELLDVA